MLYPDVNSQKKTQQTRYRTALYLRLSREDGDKTESDSIANQRTMLEAYVADHPELCIVDEFVDDGYSGSNFERPAFQNLFRELEQGTINCVLVKDLSRFGRNYIEVGRYVKKIEVDRGKSLIQNFYCDEKGEQSNERNERENLRCPDRDGIYFDWRLLPASLESATDSSGWPLGDAAQGVPETAKTSLLSEPAAEWKAGRCFGRRGRTGSRAI